MDTLDNMTIADVLEKTAVELEVHGWCRGTFSNAQGHQCLSRAIDVVDSGMWYSVKEALRQELGGLHPVVWNDKVARDKRQVTRMLRRVAKKLRAQQ